MGRLLENRKLIKAALAFFLIVLLASLAGNFFLFHIARKFYKQSILAKAFPLEPQRRTPKKDSHYKIVFLGDSRITHWSLNKYFPGLNAHNSGYFGNTSAQILLKFQPEVLPLKPEQIVIQLGINDLKIIGVSSSPTEQRRIIDNCIANIMKIIEDCKNNNIEVIYTDIIYPAEPDFYRLPFWSKDIATAVTEVNRKVRERIPQEWNVIFYNPNKILCSQNVLDDQYRRDTLHMNQKAYKAISAELLPLIQQGRK